MKKTLPLNTMLAKNCKVIFLAYLFYSLSFASYGQTCGTDLLQGQNLVANPDFSQGYTGWSHDAAYTKFVSGNSNPGVIYAGSSANFFNPGGFTDYPDHTATADNMMLMVDGLCTSGVKLWSQSNIPIAPNTNYYFSLWISSLKNNPTDQGRLQFDINGVNLPFAVVAPVTGQVWILAETVWNSGPTPPATVTISIENTTTTGCATEVDFAIDDISFIPGCTYASSTSAISPDLGPDQTICGKGGAPISLNVVDDGINDVATNEIWWSDGVGNGTGGAGSGQFTRSINPPAASLPMTMAVCTRVNGGCIKTDLITISADYAIDLGANRVLCDPAYVTMDAGFTGTGVTYQWFKESNSVAGWQQADTVTGGKTRPYLINSAGTYRVEVYDPSCGMRFDEVTITSTAPTPVNQTFCPTENVTLSVTPVNSGKYKWWNHPTSTAPANLLQVGGASYTFSASNPSTYTFYAEDTSSFNTNVGPPVAGHGFTNPGGRGVQGETELIFNVTNAFTLNSITIQANSWSCPDNRNFEITIYNAGNAVVGVSNQMVSLCGAGGSVVQGIMPINIALPVGSGYKMKLTAGSNLTWYNNGAVYPMTYTAMTITGNSTSGWANNAIPAFLNWSITAGSGCTRVPVQAIHNCPQPVDLISFTATPSSKKILLNWTTGWEELNDYFIVERSYDGTSFEIVGRVEGNGTTSHNSSYALTDNHPLSGSSYYRLVQYDIDGTAHYSPVISVRSNSSTVVVSPNPNNGNFNISFLSTSGEEIKINLVNPVGQVVYQETTVSASESFSRDLNIQHLSSGVYFLHVEGVDQTSITKLVKE